MSEPNDNELSLKLQKADYATSALKSALGAVPYAGSLLSEIAGIVIPNQRTERIVKFAEALGERLAKLEQDFVKAQLKDENFTDLIEEGLRQASRSLSDERREYIASIIANSLSSNNIEYQESKYLLRILDELSDIEIVWLRYYWDPTDDGDKEYREKHKNVIGPVSTAKRRPQSVADKETLQSSYRVHLAKLGLLAIAYDAKGKKTFGGVDKEYALNLLGHMLLREIGLSF
ncbi:MAG: hypothetical protein HY808_00995 [Nitrospirae bacterium]|nr:hypothetical protein [Nitrospirota bacterium]